MIRHVKKSSSPRQAETPSSGLSAVRPGSAGAGAGGGGARQRRRRAAAAARGSGGSGGSARQRCAAAVRGGGARHAADVTMNVKGRLLMTERFEGLGTQPGRAPEAAAVKGVLS
jgi:hypothetical protein